MPYIYLITNDINNKHYVGKTLETVEKRWKQHISDSKKFSKEHRPLYLAMQKYGIENFTITTLESVDDINLLNEKEQYWIEYYQSFKNGYNATLGGDGKQYIDYDSIKKSWDDGLNIDQIIELYNIDIGSVSKILDIYNISKSERIQRGRQVVSKAVNRIDKHGNIKYYLSISEATKDLNKPRSSHIQEVCNHKRKSAYGYMWEWAN